ncbi:MAG: hypothetical protein LH480_01865 [Rubrivivax sp.]|nr:hypothetical protein [Rubrivivax sp.]
MKQEKACCKGTRRTAIGKRRIALCGSAYTPLSKQHGLFPGRKQQRPAVRGVAI